MGKEEEALTALAPPAVSSEDPAKPPALAATSGSTVSVSSTHNASQVQQWVELLENKPPPGDKQAMAVWMLNLMNATEGGGVGAAAAAMAAPSPGAGAVAPVAAAPVSNVAQGETSQVKEESTFEEEG